jgi:hypothetical protein
MPICVCVCVYISKVQDQRKACIQKVHVCVSGISVRVCVLQDFPRTMRVSTRQRIYVWSVNERVQ